MHFSFKYLIFLVHQEAKVDLSLATGVPVSNPISAPENVTTGPRVEQEALQNALLAPLVAAHVNSAVAASSVFPNSRAIVFHAMM